jgi:glycosyltransferase involved in cell wall biosynthesis
VYPTSGNFIQRHAEIVGKKDNVTVIHVVCDPELKNRFEISDEVQKGIRTIIVYFAPSGNRIIQIFRKLNGYRLGFSIAGPFDLIHLNIFYYYGAIALAFNLIKGIPYLITEHWTSWNNGSFSKIELLTAKIILSRVSVILPVCKKLGENIKSNGINAPQVVIPNAVDTQIFYPSTEAKAGFTFLHISSLLDKQKNVTGILKVTQKLIKSGNYEFELHIGGDGDLTPVEQFVRANGLESRIKTFGMLTPDEVARKMRESNVFVLFSNEENQPCVINEAFACGLPVIATDVGGIAEYFPGNFGLLISMGNDQELYAAMKKCLDGHIFASSDTLVRYARQTFDDHVIAEQFHTIYSSVLN